MQGMRFKTKRPPGDECPCGAWFPHGSYDPKGLLPAHRCDLQPEAPETGLSPDSCESAMMRSE